MLTLDKIYHAAFVLKEVARRTDLIHAPNLCPDAELYLKTENLQATGSFKVSDIVRSSGLQRGKPCAGRCARRHAAGRKKRSLYAGQRAHQQG